MCWIVIVVLLVVCLLCGEKKNKIFTFTTFPKNDICIRTQITPQVIYHHHGVNEFKKLGPQKIECLRLLLIRKIESAPHLLSNSFRPNGTEEVITSNASHMEEAESSDDGGKIVGNNRLGCLQNRHSRYESTSICLRWRTSTWWRNRGAGG